MYTWTEIPSPEHVKRDFDKVVVGQGAAKIRLSIAASNHFHRFNHNQRDGALKVKKSNILLVGPTGSGKTLLAQTLATFFKAPFFIADATKYTSAGYIGDKVENMVLALLEKCGWNKEKTESGMIYIDEIDKITASGEGKDVNGAGVQQALLKILEGTILRFELPKGAQQQQDNQTAAAGGGSSSGQTHIEIDTSNILFICGGAFSGLEKIIEKRTRTGSSIGFGAQLATKKTIDDHFASLEDEDLVKFGFMPEFVGRLTTRAILKTLTVDELILILTNPNNSVLEENRALLNGRVEIVAERDGLVAIAEEARKKGTGARGLRTVIDEVLMPVHYYGRPERFVIDRKTVSERLSPEEFARSVEDALVNELASETEGPILVSDRPQPEPVRIAGMLTDGRQDR